MINKQVIVGIIIGVCIAVTAYHVWFLYKINKDVKYSVDGVNNIVNFINSLNKQNGSTTQ